MRARAGRTFFKLSTVAHCAGVVFLSLESLVNFLKISVDWIFTLSKTNANGKFDSVDVARQEFRVEANFRLDLI